MALVRISELRATGSGGGMGEGISLDGATTVTEGTTETYFITNHDDFSVYTVDSNVGTATITGDTISLDIPASPGVDYAVLTVTRNGSPKTFQIAIGASSVATPSIVSPATGSIGIPTSVTLQATAFTSVPSGAATVVDSRWQVATDSGFSNIIVDETKTTGNLAQLTANDLPRNTVLFARVRYNSSIGLSNWSATTSFTTINFQINKPTVSVVGGTSNVGETPTFNSSTFSATPVGSDTHVATSWVLRKVSDSTVVWQLNSSATNKNSVTIPEGLLQVSTEYTMEVKHIGGFGESVFSDKLTFVTAQSFIPDVPGTPFDGGYYAGRINVGGQIYAIVVAPKALGGESSREWKTSNTTTTGTTSTNDGWANTDAMATAGIANHPAVQFCRGLSIGGYNDWYLPAKDELEILYRNFKPTTQANYTGYGANPSSVPPTSNYTSGNPAQTSIALFRQGGAEAFRTDNWYWSSTQRSSSEAQFQYFLNGSQTSAFKTDVYYVRAIRRVLIS